MSISISSDNQRYLDEMVASGRFIDQSTALDEAVSLLRRRESLIQEINPGIDQLDAGESVRYTEKEFDRFLSDIKTRSASESKVS